MERQLSDQGVINWVQGQARKATVTMSVCNGALILAKAGLLDGLEATTTFALIPKLQEAAPKTKVVDNKRYVDNGNVITTPVSLPALMAHYTLSKDYSAKAQHKWLPWEWNIIRSDSRFRPCNNICSSLRVKFLTSFVAYLVGVDRGKNQFTLTVAVES